MFRLKTTHLTAVSLLAMLATTASIHAQETTSAIQGSVTTAENTPIAGASVVIKHVPSGTRATATTDSSGNFNARGLRVGGPYEVSITASGYRTQNVTDIKTELGQDFRLTTQLTVDDASGETIIITAS
jgi:hypothetical protein